MNNLFLNELINILKMDEEELFRYATAFLKQYYKNVVVSSESYIIAYNDARNPYLVAHMDIYTPYYQSNKVKTSGEVSKEGFYPYYYVDDEVLEESLDKLYVDDLEKEIIVSNIKGLTYIYSDSIFKNQYSDLYSQLGGDDRVGVAIIFHYLRKNRKKRNFNVALFSGEESGATGVRSALRNNKVRSILGMAKCFIELDRKGYMEYVLYHEYSDEQVLSFLKFLEQYFKKGSGSFSDISVITQELGTLGINLSVGYYNQHSPNEHIILEHALYTYETLPKILKKLEEFGVLKEKIENIRKNNIYKYNKDKNSWETVASPFYSNDNPTNEELKKLNNNKGENHD